MVETVSAQFLPTAKTGGAAPQGLEPGTEVRAKVEANLPNGVVRLATSGARLELRVPSPLPVGGDVTVTVSGSRQQPAIQITTSSAAPSGTAAITPPPQNTGQAASHSGKMPPPPIPGTGSLTAGGSNPAQTLPTGGVLPGGASATGAQPVNTVQTLLQAFPATGVPGGAGAPSATAAPAPNAGTGGNPAAPPQNPPGGPPGGVSQPGLPRQGQPLTPQAPSSSGQPGAAAQRPASMQGVSMTSGPAGGPNPSGTAPPPQSGPSTGPQQAHHSGLSNLVQGQTSGTVVPGSRAPTAPQVASGAGQPQPQPMTPSAGGGVPLTNAGTGVTSPIPPPQGAVQNAAPGGGTVPGSVSGFQTVQGQASGSAGNAQNAIVQTGGVVSQQSAGGGTSVGLTQGGSTTNPYVAKADAGGMQSMPGNARSASPNGPLQQAASVLRQPLAEQQAGMGALFAQIGALTAAQGANKVSLPDPVQKAMQQILGLRFGSAQASGSASNAGPTGNASALAQNLQKAVQQSGQFREASLAKTDGALPNTSTDLKSTLMSFRNLLQRFGAEAQIVKPARQPVVPSRQGRPQGQAPQSAASAGSAKQVLQGLLQDTDAALARIRMTQMVNSGLASDDAPQTTATRALDIVLEVPMVLGQETAVMQMQIGREGGGTQDDENEDPAWRLQFALDLTATGPLEAAVSLRGGGTYVSLWIDRKETLDAFSGLKETMEAAFAHAGLDLQELRFMRGLPPKTAAKYGALIDKQS